MLNISVETTSRITSCSIIFLIRLVATNRLSIRLQNNRQLVATNRLRYFYLRIFIQWYFSNKYWFRQYLGSTPPIVCPRPNWLQPIGTGDLAVPLFSIFAGCSSILYIHQSKYLNCSQQKIRAGFTLWLGWKVTRVHVLLLQLQALAS